MQKSIDSFQFKLLRQSCLILSIAAFLFFVINLFSENNYPVLISSGIFSIVSISCFYLLHKPHFVSIVKYTISLFSFFLILTAWYFSYTSYGLSLSFFTVWILFIVFVWERPHVFYFLGGCILIYITLAYIDSAFPHITATHKNNEIKIIDMYYGIFFTLILVFFYSFFIKRAYVKKIRKVEKAESLKTTFLQNISHEIRTPMNAILGFSELLKKQNISEKNKLKYLETINTSGQHLLSIIDDIMSILLLDSEQVKVNTESVRISTLLLQLYDEIKENKLIHPNVIIRSPIIELDKDYIIKTDAVKLKQILLNLLINAAKFTSVGYIEFGCKRNELNLEFYVKDTGIGIDEKNHTVIFDRFTQVEKTKLSRYKGTGLGLPISKSFIALLGGKIWLHSKLDEGTTFFVSIPFEESKDIQTLYNEKVEKKPKKTILIAEDEDINYEFIKILLEKKYRLYRAKNGEEVLQIIESGKKVDCILMDIKMPRLNGIEAAKIIKKTHSDIYIIAQTAYTQIESEFNVSHTCFDDYILKPINSKALQNLLDIILG